MKTRYISAKKIEMPFIYMWSFFFLGMVYTFTLAFEQANIILYLIYFICAIPFFYHLDKLTCICFLLSTMSYYFLGGDEGVWSLYSILALLTIFKTLIDKRLSVPGKSVKVFLYLLWLISAVILSYTHSEFGYVNGMYAMLYNILFAVLISLTVKVEKDTLSSFLPKMVVFQLIAYTIMLLLNGSFDGYGLSVSAKINHNTFGSSVAILSVILLIKIVFFRERKFVYKAFWLVSLLVTFITGSRNALLAMMMTSVLIYIVYQIQQGKALSGGVKFLTVVCVLAFIGGLILPDIGIDLTRYNYVELISTGGSNRTIIWKTLAPVIWEKHKWFGYGPSHFCSEQMIITFLNRDYTHTHNTIFEAWGEMGLYGVTPFLLILIWTFKRGCYYIKYKDTYLLFSFLFLEFLLLGLGESFFANIELWIVIGILIGGFSGCQQENSKLLEDVK